MVKTNDIWEGLNERQQHYMRLIYKHDRIQEKNAKSLMQFLRRSLPAEQWRWIEYGNTYTGYTYLKQDFVDAGLVDQGTGSTFEALRERGLILVRGNVEIRLTTRGRALVRKHQHVEYKTPKSLPIGTLREWHWRALCRAYVQGEKGMGHDTDTGDGFGYVSWNSCLRLRDYTVKKEERSLIRERYGVEGGLCITEYGRQFYRKHWQQYRELYPNVDAPEPEKDV